MVGNKYFTVQTDMRVLERFIKTMKGKPVRILHDGVDYGIHNEFGTSRMSAQPFMTPAAEGVRGPFLEGWKQVSNLEQADDFVELTARRAEGIAKANARVDTGAMKASIKVSKPEDFDG